MSIQSEILGRRSLAELATIYNEMISTFELDAKPVTKFASKAIAIAKVSNLAGTSCIGISENEGGAIQFEPEPLSEGDDGSGTTSVEGSGTENVQADASAPFVKLPKDQLPPKGTPEREAYRAARRKAARLARKS